MRVLVGGSSGLIGTALVARLAASGHGVVRLRRVAGGGDPSAASPGGSIPWDPERGILQPHVVHGIDGVINLSGTSIASGRWTTAKKQAILDSRVRSTLLLAERIAAAPADLRPRVFVAASAMGYYGSRGDEALTESSEPGEGFLADVCRAWEEAASPAARAGVRVANVRTALVLSRKGGALKSMLLPFRLGLGGPVGDGQQWWPWISLEDVVSVYVRLLEDDSLAGPFNVGSPEPVRSAEFVRALGRALKRPTIFPAPAFALRLALGEMADELLLTSERALPEKLTKAGFQYAHPRLDSALRAALE